MPLTRSEQMSRIRGRNTEPERLLRSMLWRAGLRYRIHLKTPAGRPDVVFPGARVAVFVDGCFWHGCPEHYVRPRSSEGFWAGKLKENVARDVRQTAILEDMGWRVCRFWEHEIFEHPDQVVASVKKAVHRRNWTPGRSWRVHRVTEIAGSAGIERRCMRDLRDPGLLRTVTRKRSTRKWTRRPTGMAVR